MASPRPSVPPVAPSPPPRPSAPASTPAWIIRSTSDTDPGLEPASLLLLGAPKTGKTEAALSWPKPFVVQWDRNLATLLAHRGVPYVVPRSRAEWVESILPTLINGGLKDMDVETIVFDSFSSFAAHQEMEVRGRSETMSAKDGDWQMLKNRHISDFNQLARLHNEETGNGRRYNMVVTCHEQEQYTSTGVMQEQRLIGIKPLVAGQMSNLLAASFDLVLCLERKVEVVTEPGKPGRERVRYVGRALEKREYKTPAGGTIWGKSLPIGELSDITYQGLRRLCGLGPNRVGQGEDK